MKEGPKARWGREHPIVYQPTQRHQYLPLSADPVPCKLGNWEKVDVLAGAENGHLLIRGDSGRERGPGAVV